MLKRPPDLAAPERGRLALLALLLLASPAHAKHRSLANVPCVELGPADGPLVVALHHQGGSPEETAQLLAARLPSAHILAPAAEAKHGRHSWYTGSSAAAKNESVKAASKRLAALLDALPSDARPIVTGYSQGGIMALALTIERPAKLRAVIAVSGRIPTAMLNTPPTSDARPPITLLHGKQDATISFASGERSRATLERAGYPVTLRPYPSDGHGLSRERLADWLRAIELATGR